MIPSFRHSSRTSAGSCRAFHYCPTTVTTFNRYESLATLDPDHDVASLLPHKDQVSHSSKNHAQKQVSRDKSSHKPIKAKDIVRLCYDTGYDFVYWFIWGFTSLSTLYRSYHDG